MKTRQEIVDEIVLKRDSKDPEDIQRVEELRKELVDLDLEAVMEAKLENPETDEDKETEALEEKLEKTKKTVKIVILILAILFLVATVFSMIYNFWFILYVALPILAVIVVIYLATMKPISNMEVELEIRKNRPKNK